MAKSKVQFLGRCSLFDFSSSMALEAPAACKCAFNWRFPNEQFCGLELPNAPTRPAVA